VTRNHARLKRRTAALNLRNLIGPGKPDRGRNQLAWQPAPRRVRCPAGAAGTGRPQACPLETLHYTIIRYRTLN
jgi:hypothetical protein